MTDEPRSEIGDAPEEWRSVIGFGENLYEVSSLGRVRRIETGYVLKPRPKKNGYFQVCLSVSGCAKNRHVHILVARAFIGPCPTGEEVNHKNHRKSDNGTDNLEYMTHQRNTQEAGLRGLMGRTDMGGTKNGNAKLNDDDVREIRRLFDSGVATRRELANRFNITWEQANNIVRRRAWKKVF